MRRATDDSKCRRKALRYRAANALDDVELPRSSGAAAAVQAGPFVSAGHIRQDDDHLVGPRHRPALRRRAGRQDLFFAGRPQRRRRRVVSRHGAARRRDQRVGQAAGRVRLALRTGLRSRLRQEPLLLRLLCRETFEPRRLRARRHAGLPLHGEHDRSACRRSCERETDHLVGPRRSQRRLFEVRPRRLPLHLIRRRRRRLPARRTEVGPRHDDVARQGPTDRRSSRRERQAVRHSRRQSVRQPGRCARRDVVLRHAQPVEDELRSQNRRSVGRRRRLGIVGTRLPRSQRGQLRLEHRRREPAGSPRRQARPDADRSAAARNSAHRRRVDHRRLRLSWEEISRTHRTLHLRRLGNAPHLGAADRRRQDRRAIRIDRPDDPDRRLRRRCRRRTLPARLRRRRHLRPRTERHHDGRQTVPAQTQRDRSL